MYTKQEMTRLLDRLDHQAAQRERIAQRNRQMILDRLHQQGSNLADFARRHGFDYSNVHSTITDWVGTTEGMPSSPERLSILLELQQETGLTLKRGMIEHLRRNQCKPTTH